MKILLLILAGISMLILVGCSKDESYIIIGCGGLVEESDYFKELPEPEDHDVEHKPNEFTKTGDPGIQ